MGEVVKNYCPQCGNEISKEKKFCNSSCAAKYNNHRRNVSNDTKQKISNSVRRHYNSDNTKRTKSGRILYACTCECGKVFYSVRKNARFCSPKCSSSSDEVKEKIKKKVEERIKEGTFSGWKTRNIKSYPEKFWEEVLTNNNISFIREDFSTKKYFIDFLIIVNGTKIDLEIDGKQHKETERKEHDKQRDMYLKSHGYLVYRVEWNEINSNKGKSLMKTKIDEFLKFYNSRCSSVGRVL